MTKRGFECCNGRLFRTAISPVAGTATNTGRTPNTKLVHRTSASIARAPTIEMPDIGGGADQLRKGHRVSWRPVSAAALYKKKTGVPGIPNKKLYRYIYRVDSPRPSATILGWL